jgi:hypothetical protein
MKTNRQGAKHAKGFRFSSELGAHGVLAVKTESAEFCVICG